MGWGENVKSPLCFLPGQNNFGIWGYPLGYSDDNICLAPSLNALQDMLKTCQDFAAEHNLKFSTDVNPTKCKTKTMAFLKTQRSLPKLMLCGNPLPWTDKCKHLGTTITTKIDGCEEDMRIKNAMYIEKNIELNQEFHFAHPSTKLRVNSIYNSHYTSSPLWNLFGAGALKIESSFNRLTCLWVHTGTLLSLSLGRCT